MWIEAGDRGWTGVVAGWGDAGLPAAEVEAVGLAVRGCWWAELGAGWAARGVQMLP